MYSSLFFTPPLVQSILKCMAEVTNLAGSHTAQDGGDLTIELRLRLYKLDNQRLGAKCCCFVMSWFEKMSFATLHLQKNPLFYDYAQLSSLFIKTCLFERYCELSRSEWKYFPLLKHK